MLPAGAAVFGPAHHVPAMLLRSGVLRSGEAGELFRQTLHPDPPWRMTYWHRYADLDAAWRVGAVGWGLEYIRRHWGRALELGMTALWGAFDPAWISSDPHAVFMVAAEHARYGGYETCCATAGRRAPPCGFTGRCSASRPLDPASPRSSTGPTWGT